MIKTPYITGIIFLLFWAFYNHIVAYDFGIEMAEDQEKVIRHVIFYVMIYGTIASLFYSFYSVTLGKFEKSIFLLIFSIVSYHIVLEIIALLSFPDNIKNFKAVVNNATLDNIELALIISWFIYRLWFVLLSNYGKSASRSFSRLQQSFSSFLNRKSK